jgi:hypothetical protein
MSTNFPTSIDSYSTLYDNTTTIMAVYINDVQDAMEALQAKMGDNTATNTLNYKISNFWNTDRGGCWFHADTAPLRWTIVTDPGGMYDRWLGLKGGSIYVTGGTLAGTKYIGGTYAGDPVPFQWSEDWHVHRLFYYSSPYSYSFNVGGGPINSAAAGARAPGLSNNIGNGDPRLGKSTNASEAFYTAYYEHFHTHTGNWRPRAAVGILAEYTG